MADFAAQRKRNEAERQARITKKRSSSSSSGSSAPVKQYVDKSGVIRREGSTGYKESAYSEAVKGGVKGTSGLVSLKATSFGSVGGKFYTNLTQKELETNKLASDSVARIDPSRTKIIQGKATTSDIFKALNTSQIDLSKRNMLIASRQLAQANIIQRNLRQAETIKASQTANKPVLTLGKLLEINNRVVQNPANVKFFKNSAGQVIGIQDPFSRSSYRLSTPRSPVELSKLFARKQLEKEFFDRKENLFATLKKGKRTFENQTIAQRKEEGARRLGTLGERREIKQARRGVFSLA